jgi:beta-galactosidase
VAILFDYASSWAWETQPQGADFSYFHLVFDAYRALRRLGVSIDFVDATEDAALAGYRLVLGPGIATLPAGLIARLARHEGTVVLGPRANARTAEMATPVPLPPALPGLDAVVARVESLPPGQTVAVGDAMRFHRWFEHIEGGAAQDGLAMAASGRLGYLQGWPDPDAWARLMERLCEKAGVATEWLPEGLRLRDTPTRRFAFNYGPEPVAWEGRDLPPAGVAWRARPGD